MCWYDLGSMVLDEISIEGIARRLVEAEAQSTPTGPLPTEIFPTITVDDSYKVQLKIIELKKQRGEVIIGRKIGLTSRAMQELRGITEPDFGYLTDQMVVLEGTPIKTSELIQPRAEAELAFVLGEDLRGPGILVSDVLRATDAIMPCLEIIDRRMKGQYKIQDTVADSAGSGRVVFGGRMVSPYDVDLRHIGMVFEKNGEEVATAAGAAVLGNPAQAVAWLANKLSKYDVYLNARETIISGSLIAAVECRAGDYVRATFDHLGSVGAKFID